VNGPRVLFAVGASLLVHVGIGVGLRLRPTLKLSAPEVRAFEVRMVPQPPEPEKPVPPPPEPPQVEPAPPKPAPPKPTEPPPALEETEAPPANEPEPLPEAPAPLALLDSSIQAAVSGVATSTALDASGGISRGSQTPAPTLLPAPPPAAPSYTALADLSRKPRPPSLDALLRKNYPEPLRRRGVEGQALVRAHVTPRGRVARVEVLSESAAGFADACKRTLLGSEWTEPLDQNGNSVATQLTYRCKFQIER